MFNDSSISLNLELYLDKNNKKCFKIKNYRMYSIKLIKCNKLDNKFLIKSSLMPSIIISDLFKNNKEHLKINLDNKDQKVKILSNKRKKRKLQKNNLNK